MDEGRCGGLDQLSADGRCHEPRVGHSLYCETHERRRNRHLTFPEWVAWERDQKHGDRWDAQEEELAVKAVVRAFQLLGYRIRKGHEAPKEATGRRRIGPNAPTRDEAARVRLFDRTMHRLLQRGITAGDVADGLGVGVSTVEHLRANLQAHSLGQRQAAERLLGRIIAQADSLLAGHSSDGSGQ